MNLNLYIIIITCISIFYAEKDFINNSIKNLKNTINNFKFINYYEKKNVYPGKTKNIYVAICVIK